jgi:hypothetical protein
MEVHFHGFALVRMLLLGAHGFMCFYPFYWESREKVNRESAFFVRRRAGWEPANAGMPNQINPLSIHRKLSPDLFNQIAEKAGVINCASNKIAARIRRIPKPSP